MAVHGGLAVEMLSRPAAISEASFLFFPSAIRWLLLRHQELPLLPLVPVTRQHPRSDRGGRCFPHQRHAVAAEPGAGQPRAEDLGLLLEQPDQETERGGGVAAIWSMMPQSTPA